MRRSRLIWVGLGVAAATLIVWYQADHRGVGGSFWRGSASTEETRQQQAQSKARNSAASEQQAAEEQASAIKRARRAEALAAAEGNSRFLVIDLAQIDLSKPLTYESAGKWKQAFSELVAQGTAAIPAIREYLQKNEDINFSIARGGILLGQPSFRAALLNALHQIGGQESTDLMVETLKSSVTPTEIGLLADYLDQQAPGQHQTEVINAANDAFKLAAEGQLPGWDVAPLFQMLQRLDTATATTAVQNLFSQWKYYSALTLAGLQGGQGINTLIQQTQSVAGGSSGQSDFAYQMVAQVAAQYPQASDALVKQARQGQIPDSAWPGIAMALSGEQYSMVALSAEGQPELPSVSGIRTYHFVDGNQNFYSVPLAAIANPDAAVQRRAIIDQLLALNPGDIAAQYLKQARAQLTTLASR